MPGGVQSSCGLSSNSFQVASFASAASVRGKSLVGPKNHQPRSRRPQVQTRNIPMASAVAAFAGSTPSVSTTSWASGHRGSRLLRSKSSWPLGSNRLSTIMWWARRVEAAPATRTLSPALIMSPVMPFRRCELTEDPSSFQTTSSPSSMTATLTTTCGFFHMTLTTSPSSSTTTVWSYSVFEWWPNTVAGRNTRTIVAVVLLNLRSTFI